MAKSNKYFYITTQSGLEDLEKQLSGSVCLLTLQPNQLEGQYGKTIEAYVTQEVEKEYNTIKQSLEKLILSYDSQKPLEASRILTINAAIKDFDEHFLSQSLSLEYLKERLKLLKNNLARLESSEHPLVPQAFHKMSIFSNKITSAYHQIDDINSQVENWVQSYT